MDDNRNNEMLETIEESGLAIVNEIKTGNNAGVELTVVDESGVWVITVKRLGITGDGYRAGGL